MRLHCHWFAQLSFILCKILATSQNFLRTASETSDGNGWIITHPHAEGIGLIQLARWRFSAAQNCHWMPNWQSVCIHPTFSILNLWSYSLHHCPIYTLNDSMIKGRVGYYLSTKPATDMFSYFDVLQGDVFMSHCAQENWASVAAGRSAADFWTSQLAGVPVC